jgi:hypothetical protein
MIKSLKTFFNQSSMVTKLWTATTGTNLITAGLYITAANPALASLYLGLAALNVTLVGMYWQKDKNRATSQNTKHLSIIKTKAP